MLTEETMSSSEISCLEVINKLREFWERKGVIEFPAYDLEMGAATFSPFCFFGSLHEKEENIMYLQACRRKADCRYGLSYNRLAIHHQFQVIIKPTTQSVLQDYLDSLEYIGISLEENDIRMYESSWESTSLGAFGYGWESRCNSMEITQFTYFQKMAGFTLSKIPCEIAYGIERLIFCINKKSIYDCYWDKNIKYKDLFQERERQLSIAYLEINPISETDFRREEKRCNLYLEKGLYYPAYESILLLNNLFNEMDAMQLIGEFDRKVYVQIIRNLAQKIAILYKTHNKN